MIDIREYVPLASMTTLGAGGPARFFVTVKSVEELQEAVRFAEERSVPLFILVGGSNVLISDEGFPGLVIRMALAGVDWTFKGDRVLVRAAAGETWDALVEQCVSRGWQGIECLSGIPGSVGAAPVQNIGAYGVSVSSSIHTVEVFDRREPSVTTRTPDACAFSYRDSIFKHEEGAHFIILSVTFSLSRAGLGPVPSYHDLQERFADQSEAPLQDLREAILEIRARKGMVILPGYETYKSAGSFFKNPVVNPEGFARIETSLISYPDGACTPPWFWAQKNGQIKIAAACLMEAAGFPKGYREGPVGISPKHALAIINHGGATAHEICTFVEKIQAGIHEQFGVELEPEAQFVGFDLDPRQ